MDTQDYTLDNFLAAIIHTLNPCDIYDATANALMDLLHLNGLLLMFSQQAGHVYHNVWSFGSISCQKDNFAPGNFLFHQLSNYDDLISIDTMPESLLHALTPRQQNWLSAQQIDYVYTVRYGHAIIGFAFMVCANGQTFNQTDELLLDKIFHYTAYALRNANLYNKAYRTSIVDDLSSLYNRKYAFECIDNCCSAGQPKTIIILDIDDFKLFNELYGAPEGDHLIRRCAQLLLQELAPNDMAFRYGADEFLILKDGSDISAAEAFASCIIRKMTDAQQQIDTVWDISITCGISVFPDISEDASSFLHNAEQAAYYGKQEGKGHIAVYRRGMEERTENPDLRAAYERVAPTVYALTAAIDAKDSYTFIHSMNVSKYAVILAEALKLPPSDIEIIRDAGMLHDIGKISVPEHILKKTSRLTPEEYEVMKTHVENSTKMIRYLPDMDYVIPAVVGHHERYDGTGYPRGLSKTDIPLAARILTVADCFDAMTASRPYKQPLSVSYAVGELQSNSGTQFDPILVNEFVNLIYTGAISV
jgi:diguanylate cyclase (GGDEF)-like protein/putative nucleotidyltransferase with HDIG domain